MHIYLLNLYLLIAIVFIFHFIRNYQYKQIQLLLLLFLPMFLLSALRHKTIGVDTGGYVNFFISIANAKWGTILSGGRFETGFIFYNKVLSLLSKNPQIFIAVCSFIIISLIFVFIKHYSYQPWLSVYLFITLNYYQQSFNTIRQFMAISIALLSIKFIRERSIIKHSGMILLASSIHTVAVTLWPAYILEKIELTNKTVLAIVGISIFFYINIEYVAMVISRITNPIYYHYLVQYNPGNGRTFIVAVSMFLFCYIIIKIKGVYSQNFNLWMCIIAVISYFFATKSYIFVRLAEVFAIFFVILVPNCISCINNGKLRAIMCSSIMVLCFVHYYISGILIGISRTIPYRFFFQ